MLNKMPTQEFAFASAAGVLTSKSRSHINCIRRRGTRAHRHASRCARMVSAPEWAQDTTARRTIPSTVSVVVIGAGPAGLSVSRALGERGVDVLCVDPALDKDWPNNYGTWLDELEPLGLAECTSRVWETTSVYTENNDKKTELPRTYVRVDRLKLKQKLMDLCAKTSRVTVLHAVATSIDSADALMSTVKLSNVSVDKSPLPDVRARVVIDATGHALRFVRMDESTGVAPGYQTAYGVEVELEEDLTAYSADEMLLMDYRDAHMQTTASDRELSQRVPTFLYVMPMTKRRVFFEETSLVASKPLSFEDLKRRLYQRLDHYGVRVSKVYEEENCLIPMGGALPDANQRVIAFGGAAAFVHPATGYMIARALSRAEPIADAIAAALGTSDDADSVARRVWRDTWNSALRSQRDFLNYGGEYLQKINLNDMRAFFTAFFKLPKNQWAGYLSFRLEEPIERLMFGLGVFFNTSNRVRAQLVWDSVTSGGIPFFLSVLPVGNIGSDEKQK